MHIVCELKKDIILPRLQCMDIITCLLDWSPDPVGRGVNVVLG